jgi:hypothetical protein
VRDAPEKSPCPILVREQSKLVDTFPSIGNGAGALNGLEVPEGLNKVTAQPGDGAA